MILEYHRALAIEIAKHYLGTWYLWGGDDPKGFDCSGFIIEILKSVGRFPLTKDTNAAGLYQMYPHVKKPKPGVLVFFGKGDRVLHVELCLDKNFSIGASGGGRFCTTVEKAIEYNAFVKVRPIKRGYKVIGFADPFKEI